jgi:Ca2+-transporting ATPase
LCNDAVLSRNTAAPEAFHTIGDPTEGAIVVAAARLELLKPELEKKFPRIGEVPFDSARKRMTTVHRCPEAAPEMPGELAPFCGLGAARYIIFVKGAVDGLLDISGSVWMEGKKEPLDDPLRRGILAAQNGLAGEGLRTLGVAFRLLESVPEDFSEDALERNLTFIGMFGMIDPPRPEAEAAVKICKEAGIRPVMITGDHPLTARYIAEKLGISDGGRIVTGRELDTLTPEELYDISEEAAVYARVSPEHKLSLVRALQKRGHIVAMTGDGVNDAPALKKADIGVAMGITGVDVAKEASDMILLDDNFATIVAAVEEGRVIYDNIRKFIRYIMTTNSGEIWLMLFAPFAGMPLPLLPLQILWMNLVTDGLPALGLSVEPAEEKVMRRPPSVPMESIFARGMGLHILWVGLLMALISFGLGYRYWDSGESGWQTMVFTTITLSQMAHVLAIRSGRESLFRSGLFSNKPLLSAVALTFVLQLAVVYVPLLQSVFRTTALSAEDFLIAVALSSVIFWAVELEKWLIRRRNPCYR